MTVANNIQNTSSVNRMKNVPERSDSIMDDGPMTLVEIAREKRRIWKNVIVISTSFLLLLMSFTSLLMLQSSLNAQHGLGTYSLIAVNVGLVFSSLFLVSLTIDRLTPKWTIVVCELCYLGYTVAQFYPTFYTLLPTGLLVGMAAAPVWSAQCKYISVLGMRYADLCRDRKIAHTRASIFAFNQEVTLSSEKIGPEVEEKGSIDGGERETTIGNEENR